MILKHRLNEISTRGFQLDMRYLVVLPHNNEFPNICLGNLNLIMAAWKGGDPRPRPRLI